MSSPNLSPPSHDERAPHEASPLRSETEADDLEWWVSSPALSFFAKHQRLMFGLIALLMTVVLAGGLMISQISARHGLLVFGSSPERWTAGRQAALRLEARALTLGHRAAILSATVRFESPHLPSPPPQPLTQALGVSLQGSLKLPDEPGRWTLVIEAEAISAQGVKGEALKTGLAHTPRDRALRLGTLVPLRATLSFELADQATRHDRSPLQPARTPDLLKARASDAEALVKSFAADQRLSFELPSELLILSLNEHGAPLRGVVSASVNGADPRLYPIGPDGITSLSVTPRSPTIDLELSARGIAQEPDAPPLAVSHERAWPEAHQFGLHVNTQRLGSGEEALLTLKSTQVAEALFVDLWCEEQWLSTYVAALNEAGEGQLLLPPLFSKGSGDVRANEPSLLWVQAYQSPYQPGEVRGGRYLVYQPPQLSDSALGVWLLERTKDLKVTQSEWPSLQPERWVEPLPMRLLLGRVERPKVDPMLIINSVASSEATAGLLKQQYQAMFFSFMAGLCLVILLGFAWLMRVHHKSLAPIRETLGLKGQALWWFAQVTVILLSFFGGMVYLIYTIRW